MGLMDKMKESFGEVQAKAKKAVDAKKQEIENENDAKAADAEEQSALAGTFAVTKHLGDLELDMNNRLFKVKRARVGLEKKSGALKKSGKVLAAVSTGGLSVVADKAIGAASQPSDRIFTFDELYDYELLEDDSSVTKGGLGMAVAGGALFGGLGAIAGASAGGKKTKKTVETLILKINLSDINFPCVMIPYITKSTKTKSNDYIKAFNAAQESISSLDIILRQIQREPKTLSDDYVSKLKDLKELLDADIITQEEFDAKKKDILGR